MNSKEVRTETHTNSSRTKKMRLTHIPTGKTVEGVGWSLYKLRYDLMIDLAELVGGEGR